MIRFLKNQNKNKFLYTPFLLAAGAGLYFTCTFEPNFSYILFIMAIITGLFFFKNTCILLRGLMIFLFGCCYSSIFTHIIDTPSIAHTQNDKIITGYVKSLDYTNDKTRINIHTNLDGQDMNIRVSVMENVAIPNVGDKIEATVTLFRPNSVTVPEGFDYSRWAYFNRLSATGYMTDCKVISNTGFNYINKTRDILHNKSNSFLVDALVLGYKNSVPKPESEIWMATGVGHVWSISGFHMTLVGGWLFALFYFIFRRVPHITRRTSAKIPAMCFAWVVLIIYLFLSGAETATVRAFLMTSLMFCAFIFARNAISMRNVALVFWVMFLINPHSVMQAGFQLSFAAVFGIVWLFTELNPKMPNNKILKVIYMAILTSLIATIFTAPFVAAHFGTLPIYSLLGNLILLPVFSVVIMPLVMIGCVLSLFGLSGLLGLADFVYEKLMLVAIMISELPFASVNIAHVSNFALLLFVLAGMSLMLIVSNKNRINYMCFTVFAALGICAIVYAPRPVFYTTSDHELAAFLGTDGKLGFTKSRASHHYFAFDAWKTINGEETGTKNNRIKPTDGLWHYNTDKFNLVYVQKFTALQKNIKQLCADDSVDYIVSYSDIESDKCGHKILRGGFVIYPSGRIKYIPINRFWNHSRHE